MFPKGPNNYNDISNQTLRDYYYMQHFFWRYSWVRSTVSFASLLEVQKNGRERERDYNKILVFHNAASITTTDCNFQDIPAKTKSMIQGELNMNSNIPDTRFEVSVWYSDKNSR